MIWLILGMTIAAVIAAAVIGIVAIPALRDGRQILTPRGEKVFRMNTEGADQVEKKSLRLRKPKGASS